MVILLEAFKMRRRTFISYSGADAVLAAAVYAYLNANNIDAVKAPDDIVTGEDWAASIASLIESSQYFLLIWTGNSMASKEVAKELTLAMDCGARIIPFRAEDLSPEGAWRYHLMNVQWLEAHSIPEANALEKLAHHLKGSGGERPHQDPGNPDMLANSCDDLLTGEEISSSPPCDSQEESRVQSTVVQNIPEAASVGSAAQMHLEPLDTPDYGSKEELLEKADKPDSDSHEYTSYNDDFTLAMDIAVRQLGKTNISAASRERSSKILIFYQLCDSNSNVLARVPYAMITAGRMQASSPSSKSTAYNQFSRERQGDSLLFKKAVGLASTLGYKSLSDASSSRSGRSLFNFIIRNDSGKELAKVPMEMLRNK